MKPAACLVLMALALSGCAHHPEIIERYNVAHNAWRDCTVNNALRFYSEGVDPQTSASLAMKMCREELQKAIQAYSKRMDISLSRSASIYAAREKENEETLYLLAVRQIHKDDAEMAQDPVPLEFRKP